MRIQFVGYDRGINHPLRVIKYGIEFDESKMSVLLIPSVEQSAASGLPVIRRFADIDCYCATTGKEILKNLYDRPGNKWVGDGQTISWATLKCNDKLKNIVRKRRVFGEYIAGWPERDFVHRLLFCGKHIDVFSPTYKTKAIT